MSATLTSLRIRNLALVEELLWQPSSGFTAITGETGAGKSVILGALTLLLGERADRGLLRTGAASCSVEAVFENVADARIVEVLDAAGVEPCEGGCLLIKRTIPAEGVGRQFVNGSPCTLALLRSLGEFLVDLHGPHDHQSLFSREQQTRLLDAFAGCLRERESYIQARRAMAVLESEREALREGGALREMDLLEHQTSEIAAAGLKANEEEELVARHRSAANATRIAELSAALAARVSEEDGSLSASVAEAVRTARELARLDTRASNIEAAAETAAAAVGELSSVLRDHSNSVDTDPAALAAVEARLDTLNAIKRKYGNTIAEVLEFAAHAEARLESLRDLAGRADSLESEIAKARQTTDSAADALTAKRKPAAKKLEKTVSTSLIHLGFHQSEFRISLENTEGPLGHELAEFIFAPNPGEAPRPLRAIASSGEISRVMLALKGALAQQDDVPLLVFDEIDANVGGEIATFVAQQMRALAEGRQVLCITHLPQVAAAAHHHFTVTKEVRDQRTRTLLDPCTGSSREAELARMLGGQSASALAHARQLLKSY